MLLLTTVLNHQLVFFFRKNIQIATLSCWITVIFPNYFPEHLVLVDNEATVINMYLKIFQRIISDVTAFERSLLFIHTKLQDKLVARLWASEYMDKICQIIRCCSLHIQASVSTIVIFLIMSKKIVYTFIRFSWKHQPTAKKYITRFLIYVYMVRRRRIFMRKLFINVIRGNKPVHDC